MRPMVAFRALPWGVMLSDDKNQRKIEDLQRCLRSRPDDRDLLLRLVHLHRESGQPQAAADLLKEHLGKGHADWELIRECAESYRLSGEPAEGLEWLVEMASDHEDRAEYWSLRGRMQEDVGDFEQAREEHERALRIDEDDPDPPANLQYGMALIVRGEVIIADDRGQAGLAVALGGVVEAELGAGFGLAGLPADAFRLDTGEAVSTESHAVRVSPSNDNRTPLRAAGRAAAPTSAEVTPVAGQDPAQSPSGSVVTATTRPSP